MTAAPGVCWDRLLFSAKESAYKAWFPLTGRPLRFHDAAVTLGQDGHRFIVRVLLPGPASAGHRLSELEAAGWPAAGSFTAVTVPG